MNENTLHQVLGDLPIPAFYYYDETDSTNERGLELIASGAHEFTLLVADRQTAGRGRLGRTWVSKPGTSLAFTAILHPKEKEIRYMGFFSFLGALSVCLAIEDLCDSRVEVKWPNDVLMEGKKTAGVLVESSFQGEVLAGIALGIGINLLKGSVPPPSQLMFPAACVQTHCPNVGIREEFLASVMKHLIAWRPRILEKNFIKMYRERLAFRGQKVLLIPPAGKEVGGVLRGVDDSGQLVLEMENNEEKAFPVGDLKLRKVRLSPP